MDPEQENGASRNVDVDEYVKHIGEFGRYQKGVVFLLCLVIIPKTYQTLIMAFVGNNPNWRCVMADRKIPNNNFTSLNSTGNDGEFNRSTAQQECTLNGEIGPGDLNYNDRCTMDRSSWEFTKPREFSIVTDWDLVCDKEYLSYLANSAIFIGWSFGSFWIGWASDRYGRKKVLYPTWTIMIVVGFISSFVNRVDVFIFLRVLMGLSMGTAELFILCIELVGPKYRSLAGTLLWFSFTFALCGMGLQAWLIQTWKILVMISTAPYLVLLISYKFVPESIRWLRVNHKVNEANNILQHIAKVNKVPVPQDMKLSSVSGQTKPKGSYLDIFRPKPVAISTLIQGFAWFVNAQVYYGISLASSRLGGDMYRNFVLTSLVEFPGNLLVIYFCNRFGRKRTTIYSMLAGGLSCIIVAFIPINTEVLKAIRVTLALFGKLFITLSFGAIYVWSAELYPTVIRSQSSSFFGVVATIGAATAPWIAQFLMTIHKVLPFTTMGVLAIVSSILCYKLKETLNRTTAETLQQRTLIDAKRRQGEESIEVKNIHLKR